MSKIYHIIARSQWESAQDDGIYIPNSLANDGFIHFSYADQLVSVANSFYKGIKDLIILKVDPELLEAEVKIEPPLEAPMSGILFPHLYGSLNLNAVKGLVEFPCDRDGKFQLPFDLMEE